MTGFMRFSKIYMYTYQLKMFYICQLFHSKALKSSNTILGKDEVCFAVVLTFGGNAQIGEDDGEGVGLHAEHITGHTLVVQKFICVDDPSAVIDHEFTCKHTLIRKLFTASLTPMMTSNSVKFRVVSYSLIICSPTQAGKQYAG